MIYRSLMYPSQETNYYDLIRELGDEEDVSPGRVHLLVAGRQVGNIVSVAMVIISDDLLKHFYRQQCNLFYLKKP